MNNCTENVRILAVSMNAWNDNSLNTLPILFRNLNPDNIYSIYCRTEIPNATNYKHFLQISELAVLNKFLGKDIKVCSIVENATTTISDKHSKEASIRSLYKSFGNRLSALVRDLIWRKNIWEEDLLKEYVDQSKATKVFVNVSSCIRTNKIALWASERLNIPIVLLFGDDNLTYSSIPKTPIALIHKFLIRKSIFKLVHRSSCVFVISPKMKREYDSLLGVNTELLTKPVFKNINDGGKVVSEKTKLLYCGNLLYGRDEVLMTLVDALKILQNKKLYLEIFTQSPITKKLEKKLNSEFSCIRSSIPRDELLERIRQADVLVFPESEKKLYKRSTRLSFSTKLTDYLASRKTILAIGPKDLASMEYLIENNLAFYSRSYIDSIVDTLKQIDTDSQSIEIKIKNAKICIENFHNPDDINNKLLNALL